ncbi:hypothetical protein D3C83_142020 [compost metagenome]
MHVGVKEPIAEDLGEKYLHPRASKFRNVNALGAQFGDVADRHAVHALHHHDFLVAEVPVHLGDQQQRRVLKVAP